MEQNESFKWNQNVSQPLFLNIKLGNKLGIIRSKFILECINISNNGVTIKMNLS